MISSRLFVWCLALRLVCSLVTRTAFAPDEFWQGPEVAHRMVFGYGHLTWEWAAGLRSYLHPTIYASVFWLLKIAGIDSPLLVAKSPQIVHAPLAAATDVAVYKLSKHIFDERVARWALVCQLCSWFNAYCLIRTYSSSIEAFLTAIGVLWLFEDLQRLEKERRGNERANRKSFLSQRCVGWMLAAAVACTVRPPSIIFWLITALMYLHRIHPALRIISIAKGSICALAILSLTIVWDRVWYGRWLLVPWHFLSFNLFSGGSAMYGVHPWHWNFTNGIPVVLASYLPFLAVGLLASHRKSWQSLSLSVIGIVLYSLPAHKEYRFLLPSVELLMPYCGYGASIIVSEGNKIVKKSMVQTSARTSGTSVLCLRQKVKTRIVKVLLGLQLVMACYFCLFHQRGQVEVIEFVRNQAESRTKNISILFLTPCHATPYYSFIHSPVRMRFLDCSPPGMYSKVKALNENEINGWLAIPHTNDDIVSERHYFEKDPEAFVLKIFELNMQSSWPDFIAVFEGMSHRLEAGLHEAGYLIFHKFSNGLLKVGDDDDERMIFLWKKH